MKFYFPDSQDQIDPEFDFVTEERSPLRIRQRDDRTPTKSCAPPVPGHPGLQGDDRPLRGAGRYSAQQRQRFYRVGVREFFRLDAVPGPRLDTMGDCGAFSYIDEPGTAVLGDEVIDFYEDAGFDAGRLGRPRDPVFETSGQIELIARRGRRRYELTWSSRKSSSSASRTALQVRANRCRAGMESRHLRRRPSGDSSRSATSGSPSADWCHSRRPRSSRCSKA